MKVADVAKADSRFFLKSEYGPLSDDWPAMSFSLPQLVPWMIRYYRPSSDFIVYTGTGGVETTNPNHRSRLLSLLTIDLMKTYRTEQLIPADSWREAQRTNPGQWEYSFWVVDGWNITALPEASLIVPEEYQKIGRYPYRGMVVQIEGIDRQRLLGLEISRLTLERQPAVGVAVTLGSLRNAPNLNAEAVRIANLVFNRVEASGTLQQHRAPERSAPSDLVLKVAALLMKQPLLCALCGGLMDLKPANRLLQVSPDRIDSDNRDYGPQNFQLVHLACNYAKNRFSVKDFHEWLGRASASFISAGSELEPRD